MLPCPSLSPGVCSNSCPLSQWCHPTISSSVIPSSPAFSLSQHQDLFHWVSSSHQVAQVLELQRQSFHWTLKVDFLWDWLVWSHYSPRDSQESSPTPQFESINSSVLRLLFGPTIRPTLFLVRTWLLEKTIALTAWTCVSKMMSLLLNTMSRFILAFLPGWSVF